TFFPGHPQIFSINVVKRSSALKTTGQEIGARVGPDLTKPTRNIHLRILPRRAPLTPESLRIVRRILGASDRNHLSSPCGGSFVLRDCDI
ncbi:hypothetical protein AKJ16_DCAP11027, partial [Drosera capensis]